MAFEIGGETREYELVPAGVHPAYCYGLVDLGSQEEVYSGERKMRWKVQLLFETPTQLGKDGKPMSIGAKLTCDIVSDKANLRKWLIKWRGRDFTPEELKRFNLGAIVGAGCEIEVIHKAKQGGGQMGDLIETVRKLPAGLKVPPLSRPKVLFFIKEWDQTVYDALPNWMKKAIAASPEGRAKLSGQPAQPAAGGETQQQVEDSIPF